MLYRKCCWKVLNHFTEKKQNAALGDFAECSILQHVEKLRLNIKIKINVL